MPDEASNPAGPGDERPAQRTGEDTRRRGWFWHWNTIVTQYAPLIGLKGVGLLNSYTVWTDRREDSPHRGYAFPSQQAEAAFYGEDRAELITINKILVALDLVEVRKEMVLHADEQGRRWRVPHNLYRVKDNPNGFNLTVEDVLRVAELADKTPAVYRYLRRVFSPNFAPIDSKNPWHDILPAVRQTEVWQRLAAKSAREDARASARSKAGHRKRKGDKKQTQHDDSGNAQAKNTTIAQSEPDQTSVASTNTGDEPVVPPSNKGSGIEVDESNRGFGPTTTTVDAATNEGSQTVVDSTNRTYNQEGVNTTRTTTAQVPADDARTDDGDNYPDPSGNGPVLQASKPVLVAFEAANDRAATTLERELLGELERDFADAAERAGLSIADWVVSAIREAVNSGSRFVAPKRVREILSRWSSTQGRRVRESQPATSVGRTRSSKRKGDELGSAWRAIITELQQTREWADVGDALTGSVLLGEEDGRIRIGLATSDVTDGMRNQIERAIEPRFSTHLGRQVAVDVESTVTNSDHSEGTPPREGEGAGSLASEERSTGSQPAPRFPVVDGLTNSQVWAAAQEELRGRISSANFETWIRPASLIGRDEEDRLVLGVPNRFAQQRVESKLRAVIEAVLANIVGQPVEVRVVVSQQWLREQRSS